MAYTITNCKNDVIAQFHGTTANKIVDFDGLINRAARQVLLDVDPQETIRIVSLASPIFNSIWDYACPTDLKGNGIIDIRPQVNRTRLDIVGQVYNQAFDVSKSLSLLPKTTVQWNTAVKSLRINIPSLTAQTPINNCDSLTSNGTWAAGSSASSLAVDTVNYVSNSASLKFNLASSGSTGYLENSTMTQVDLSAWKNQGYFFIYTYLPTASNFTNVILRIGSDSSNYYTATATTTQENTVFQDGWNLLSFSWASMTTVGTPVDTAIDYSRVTWTYNGTAQTAVRLDQITGALGTIYEIEYYSKYLFRSASGTFKEAETLDTDLVNLDTETYNLLLWKTSSFVAQQVQGLDAQFNDGPYFDNLYAETLQKYQSLYKSQKQKPQSVYYGVRKPLTAFTRARRGV